MLNIQFSVQGDANDKLVEIQAKGVVAALYAIYGDRVLPHGGATPVVTVSAVVNSDAPKTVAAAVKQAAEIATSSLEPVDASAAFGQQVLDAEQGEAEEPDAAAAFGTAPPAATPPTPAGERDKNGIPWDARIHASTKTKNADQTWTRRRNTPDATFDAVMAELKAGNTARTMEAATGLVPPPPATPAVPAPPPVPSAPSAPPAPPASSTAPVEGGLIDPASATAFPDIMKLVTKAQAAGKIDTSGVANLLSSLSVEPPSVSTLLTKKDYIPAFQSLLADHVAMQG